MSLVDDDRSPAASDTDPQRDHEKSQVFRKLFNLPRSERLGDYYTCAYLNKILLQGRLYLSRNYLCFYSNVFGYETKEVIAMSDILNVEKKNTMGVIPNAIQVDTIQKTYFFASFISRDLAFDNILSAVEAYKENLENLPSSIRGTPFTGQKPPPAPSTKAPMSPSEVDSGDGGSGDEEGEIDEEDKKGMEAKIKAKDIDIDDESQKIPADNEQKDSKETGGKKEVSDDGKDDGVKQDAANASPQSSNPSVQPKADKTNGYHQKFAGNRRLRISREAMKAISEGKESNGTKNETSKIDQSEGDIVAANQPEIVDSAEPNLANNPSKSESELSPGENVESKQPRRDRTTDSAPKSPEKASEKKNVKEMTGRPAGGISRSKRRPNHFATTSTRTSTSPVSEAPRIGHAQSELLSRPSTDLRRPKGGLSIQRKRNKMPRSHSDVKDLEKNVDQPVKGPVYRDPIPPSLKKRKIEDIDFTRAGVARYPFSSRAFWDLFMADGCDAGMSKFHLLEAGDVNFKFTKWCEAKSRKGLWNREIFFIKTKLSGPLGPKQTRVHKSQRCLVLKGGLVIDSNSIMPDVPYGGYFHVAIRWVIVDTKSPKSGIPSNFRKYCPTMEPIPDSKLSEGPSCLAQIWTSVEFTKFTMIRYQIKSFANAGVRKFAEDWLAFSGSQVKNLPTSLLSALRTNVGEPVLKEAEVPEGEPTSDNAAALAQKMMIPGPGKDGLSSSRRRRSDSRIGGLLSIIVGDEGIFSLEEGVALLLVLLTFTLVVLLVPLTLHWTLYSNYLEAVSYPPSHAAMSKYPNEIAF